jgi:hypothetical protein
LFRAPGGGWIDTAGTGCGAGQPGTDPACPQIRANVSLLQNSEDLKDIVGPINWTITSMRKNPDNTFVWSNDSDCARSLDSLSLPHTVQECVDGFNVGPTMARR